MIKKCLCFLLVAVMTVILIPVSGLNEASAEEVSGSLLKEEITNWKIWPSAGLTTSQGSVGVSDTDAINPRYSTDSWMNATVPGSVLGSLADDGYYDTLFGGKDVFFDDNLYKVPVADFARPWWYRTTFNLPDSQNGQKVLLTFEGINYAADIYVNGVALENQHTSVPEAMLLNYDSNGNLGANGGALNESGTGATSINYAYSTAGNSQCLAAMQNYKVWETAGQPLPKYNDKDYNVYSKQFIGAFRTYELDVTDLVSTGENTICVKVLRPYMRRDLFWSWLDWHTMPADNNMGLTGAVTVSTSGNVRISNPFISSKVSEDLKTANLILYVDLSEMDGKADTSGSLIATIYKPDGTQLLSVSRNITVPSGAYSKEYSFNWKDYPQLSLSDPELWWPHTHGDQPLYTVDYTFVVNGVVSGTEQQRFGIREIYAEINTSPMASSNLNAQMLQVYVNHKPVLLQGAGVTYIDLLWRNNETKAKNAVDYARYMGLNMLRDEGKFDRRMIEYMDEQGVVLMLGWCCCDRWEEPGRFNKGERYIAYEELYSILRFFRQHPAFINMANGSDHSPGVSGNGANGMAVQYGFFTVEAKTRLHETATIVSGSAAEASIVTNYSSGMHMNSRYDYQPPKFDFKATKGIFGFVSEGGGAGNSIPVIETLREVLPNDHIWPYNVGENTGKRSYSTWNVHASRGRFAYYDWGNVFTDNRYGASDTLEQYIMKSQVQQYDAHRANQEAVSLYRYTNTTGHVVWMYNNPWPGFFWNMFDNLMNPHGSTYGARKGNEPVHIMLDAYRKDISVINSTQNVYNDVTASLQVYDINGNVIGSLSKVIDIREDSASAPVNTTRSGLGVRMDQMVGLELDEAGSLVTKRYTYYGQINEAYGVSSLWSDAEVQKALTAPFTSVYFYRMELRDSSGRPLSHNSYVLSTKDDELNGTGDSFRPAVAQVADLTKLNELPPVELDMSVTSGTQDGKVTKTVIITNSKVKNGNAIAYAVELKTRINQDKLVAPVFYSDNLFTLFPGETRIIDITYDQKDAGFYGDAVVEYTCYNNVCNPNGINDKRTPGYARPDIALGRTGASSSSANIALPTYANGGGSRQLPVGTSFSAVTSGNNNPMVTTTIDGKTVSNLTLGWGNATTDSVNPWFYADLGSVQSIGRLNLRWSYAHRPDKVVVEVSVASTAPPATSTDWVEVAVWNNPNGASFTDIVFDTAVSARFIRIKPTGHRGAVSAMAVPGPGIGNSTISSGVYEWNGAGALGTMTQFALISFEAYSLGNNYVFFDINGNGSVECGGKAYDMSMTANQRLVPLGASNGAVLTFNPAVPASITVYRDGVNVTAQLVGNQLTLTGVTTDTNIVAYFGDLPVLSANRTKLYADDIVTVMSNVPSGATYTANIFIGLYQNGKMISLTGPVTAAKGEITPVGIKLPANVTGIKLQAFLWDEVTYVPICEALSIQ